MATDWPYYRERVTVIDALEAGLCYRGVVEYVAGHGYQIAGPASAHTRGDRSFYALITSRGNSDGDEVLGYGYLGYVGICDGSRRYGWGDGWGWGDGYGRGDGRGTGYGWGDSYGFSYRAGSGWGDGYDGGDSYGKGNGDGSGHGKGDGGSYGYGKGAGEGCSSDYGYDFDFLE